MNNCVSFNSKNYQIVSWKIIFDRAVTIIFGKDESIGLVNFDGVVMITENVYSKEKVGLCFERQYVEITHNELTPLNIMLPLSDMQFFKLKYKSLSQSYLDRYIYFIHEIIHQVYKACETIYLYTADHLSNRKYCDTIMAQIEVIKFKFVDVQVLFEQIEAQLSRNLDLIQLSFVISLVTQALENLSRLGGARAILKNNSIELLFYIKLFQKFIFNDRRIH